MASNIDYLLRQAAKLEAQGILKQELTAFVTKRIDAIKQESAELSEKFDSGTSTEEEKTKLIQLFSLQSEYLSYGLSLTKETEQLIRKIRYNTEAIRNCRKRG